MTVTAAPDGLAAAERVLRAACGDRLRTDFGLAPLTTFRIGGPATLFLEPESEADLVAVADAVESSAVPVLVLGKGSNVLVADAGFAGIVLRLGRTYRWASPGGDRVRAGAAMPLPALAGVALSHALTGLEFGIAIPGTVGGAVRMNAGAHGGEMAKILESVEVFSLRERASATVPATGMAFGYRRSSLSADAVVVAATVALSSADATEVRARMDDAREWRRRTQPLAEPNCGSVFKNPPGDHAARLVDDAGAKGLRVGGAHVSAKHANFIVTSPGATAVNVLELIRRVQALVETRTGIRLEPEVHLVGDLDPAPR
jgi:UDP-N-acetylmuramate dehydrogenase